MAATLNQANQANQMSHGSSAAGDTSNGEPGRVPPQSLEAEMAALASMALDRDILGEIIQVVRSDHFYRQDHRLIFDALVHLYEENKPVDLVLLRDELERRDQLGQIGGVDYLSRLVNSVPSAANGVYYAEIVRDKGILRSLIATTNEINKQAYDTRLNTAEMLNEVEQKIFAVTEQKVTGQEISIHEVMNKVFETLEMRNKGITGLPTGFHELDELTSGLQKGEMIIIAARPSMGKTALGLNLAEHIAADNKISAAVFSLEMSSQALAERMLCGRAHVDSQNVRKGIWSDAEHQSLVNVAGELSEAPLFIDDSAHLTPLELRAKARRLKMKHDIQILVVDYLQLMYAPGAESRQQEVGMISRHIKGLARELDIPVIVMSQLNRGPEGREGHRPRMSDLRESGNIEQDADVVMLLHREDYYHNEPDYEQSNMAEVIIAKQRNGPTGKVDLVWHPNWTRFENYSHAAEPFGI